MYLKRVFDSVDCHLFELMNISCYRLSTSGTLASGFLLFRFTGRSLSVLSQWSSLPQLPSWNASLVLKAFSVNKGTVRYSNFLSDLY